MFAAGGWSDRLALGKNGGTVFGKITQGLDVMQKIKKDDVMTKVRVA